MPARFADFPTLKQGYNTISAPAYAGFRSTLNPKQAPTNKHYPVRGLPFRILNSKLDALTGFRYTFFHQKPTGIVVTDGPTAARPDSDYQRQGSINIVALCINSLRDTADPYIGQNLTAEQELALQKALNEAMMAIKRSGYLRDFQLQLTITEDDRILGKANCYVDVIVPFELRQLSFNVALRRGA